MSTLKRTALFEEHQRLGGRLIDFGGWELPVQYTGVLDEHTACRTAAGIFDVSHMGEVHVKGPGAEAWLNWLVTNDVTKMAIGQAQYTAMCHESGGIVDDLIIYRRAPAADGTTRYLVVVNASNTDKDFAHMKAIKARWTGAAFTLANESPQYTQIAVQGRLAPRITQTITDVPLDPIKYYWFAEGKVLGSVPAILARTGYTGEDGFEIYVPWSDGPRVWRALVDAGTPLGMKACGLGARDTLRLEMKFPLYGQELGDDTVPLECGLGWVTKLAKADFIGRSAIVRAKEQGLKKTLVGLKLLERGIARHGYPVHASDGSPIGVVTSGTQSPSLRYSIAVASVLLPHSAVGTKISVDIRGTKIPAEVVATPFYKRPY